MKHGILLRGWPWAPYRANRTRIPSRESQSVCGARRRPSVAHGSSALLWFGCHLTVRSRDNGFHGINKEKWRPGPTICQSPSRFSESCGRCVRRCGFQQIQYLQDPLSFLDWSRRYVPLVKSGNYWKKYYYCYALIVRSWNVFKTSTWIKTLYMYNISFFCDGMKC
jgi:hypothetical protein